MTRCSLRQAGKVSSVNDFGLDDPVLNLYRGKIFLSSLKYPYRLRGPPSPVFNWYRRFLTAMNRPDLKLTTALHLEQKLRISRALPLLPTISLHCVGRHNVTHLAFPLRFSNTATHMFTARVIWDVIGGLK
jgi:hypothetical protein